MSQAQIRPSTQLSDAVQASMLQAFQDGIAAVSHAPAVICNHRGKPIIGASGPLGVVALLQSSTCGRERMDTILAKLATQSGSRIIDHLCFVSTQIVDRDQTLGTIVVGGLPPQKMQPAQLDDLATAFGLDDRAHQELVDVMRVWDASDQSSAWHLIQLTARVLAALCAQSRELHMRAESLGTMDTVAAMLAGTQDLQAVLNRIARQVTEAMDAKACSIRLLDEHTGELVIKAVHNLSREYLLKGSILLDANPIDRAAFDGEMVYVEDATTDPRTLYPDQARAEGIVSGLSVGMTYRGQTVGLMRVYTGVRHRFTTAEKSLLRSIASQAAAAIINSRLYLEAARADRYQRQLEYAGAIQRRMIPDAPPRHPRIDFAFVYEPTHLVGGDFLDFLELTTTGQLGVCVADVVGKGIPAALMMASLRTAFRLYAYATLEITEALTMTNIHMCRETLKGEFATLFYGVFAENGRALTYCNAGHNPPALLRGGKFRFLEKGGMILGVNDGESFTKQRVVLRAHDVLVLYTDGVIDATNFSGQTFGKSRLLESIQRYADLGARLIAHNIVWDIRRFVGLADQADDITLVVAKIR